MVRPDAHDSFVSTSSEEAVTVPSSSSEKETGHQDFTRREPLGEATSHSLRRVPRLLHYWKVKGIPDVSIDALVTEFE